MAASDLECSRYHFDACIAQEAAVVEVHGGRVQLVVTLEDRRRNRTFLQSNEEIVEKYEPMIHRLVSANAVIYLWTTRMTNAFFCLSSHVRFLRKDLSFKIGHRSHTVHRTGHSVPYWTN